MKILYLSHVLPYPPTDGMRSTCYQILRHMSKFHDITLLCLAEKEEMKFFSEISKECAHVVGVPHRAPRSFFKRLKNVLFEKDPFCVLQFYSLEYEKRLEELLEREKFDVVHILSINISNYAQTLKGIPTLFFPHDSVSLQFYRNLPYEKNLLRRFYMGSQWKKMLRYEKKILPQFTHTVLVSQRDKDWIAQHSPKAEISIIPAGVDCDYFKPEENGPEDAVPSVLFRGVMNFPPNRDAVLYFYYHILPLIKKEIPKVRFYVVGKEPPPEILRLNDSVTTFVEGLVPDLRPYIAKSSVNICPMLSGSGIKNKILEAWAMGKAVVATSKACEGVAALHEKNILIADAPETFAQSVIQLLRNSDLRREIGKNGRELVSQQYSWESSIAKFKDLYNEIAPLRAD